MPLTDDARKELSTTVRALQARLLTDLGQAVDARYKLGLPTDQAGLGEAARVQRTRLEAWLEEEARASGASSL